MFRANDSFHTALPDGTERFVGKGEVVADDDVLVEINPQLFQTFDLDPVNSVKSAAAAQRRAAVKK